VYVCVKFFFVYSIDKTYADVIHVRYVIFEVSALFVCILIYNIDKTSADVIHLRYVISEVSAKLANLCTCTTV